MKHTTIIDFASLKTAFKKGGVLYKETIFKDTRYYFIGIRGEEKIELVISFAKDSIEKLSDLLEMEIVSKDHLFKYKMKGVLELPVYITTEIKRIMEDLCSKTIEGWNDHAMPFTECDRLAVKEVENFLTNNNIIVK